MGTVSATAIVRQQARAFGRNLAGFLRFDPAAYDAIQSDPLGSTQGLAAMALASLAAAVGHVGLAGGERPLEVAFAGEVAVWAIAAGLAWFLAITLFRPPRNPASSEILPLLAFAQVPQALGLLAPLPVVGAFADAVGTVLFAVYVVAALRAAVGFDLLRSAVNGVLGVAVAIVALVGVVVGNGLDAAALGAYRPLAGRVSTLAVKVDEVAAPLVRATSGSGPAAAAPEPASALGAAPAAGAGKGAVQGKGKGQGKGAAAAAATAVTASPTASPATAAAKQGKNGKNGKGDKSGKAQKALVDLATPAAGGAGGDALITAFP